MKTFTDYLNDPVRLTAALSSLVLSDKESADLETLYRNPGGVSVTRDSGSRVRGETVHSSSRIGKYLSSHFDGVGPRDSMMWVGFIPDGRDRTERWVLRPQIRQAIDQLGWFGQQPPPATPFPPVPQTMSEVQRKLDSAVAASLNGTQAARLERLRNAPSKPPQIAVTTTVFQRNPDVVAEVLFRAQGVCEGCGESAPFFRASDGSPYLEVHHRIQLSHGGDDTVENAVALCPNCHRERHYGRALVEI